jgi:uncharacterized protein YjiS (DUF1127 family)
MSSNALHPAQLALLNGQAQLPTLARVAVTVAVMATKWDMNWRTRKALGRLDPYELDDIGLSTREASTEANKRFYQR